MSVPAFDELLRRLTDAEVEFVLVGGLALGAWGVVRGTNDLDIVADPNPANLDRIAAVAVEANGHVQTEDALLSSRQSISARLGEGEHVALETELGRLGVVQGLPGVPSYAELHARATEAEILGVTVAVCALEHLREMKRPTSRTRDLADLEDLETALGED